MRYKIHITGLSPIIFHNAATGLDPYNPIRMEINSLTRKKGSNRTEADDLRIRYLESLGSLYLDENDRVTIPAANLRACIEKGARKLRQGPQVREGLIVETVDQFIYDQKTYGKTAEQVAVKAQFTVPVVVQRNRILRTRAKLNPWGLKFTVLTDPELVDESQLIQWLTIGGTRIGLGDWRPEKSGQYGRFQIETISQIN